MRQILITKGDVNYAYDGADDITGADEITGLADGALACLEKNGTLVDDTLPNVTQDAIYFALGRTSYGPLLTPLIDIASLKYQKTAYVAPVAKVIVVGSNTDGGTTYNCNLPSSPVAGTTAEIMLIDQDKPHHDRTREKIYQYVVKTGDTAATIEAAIIAKINADANRIATAAEIDSTNHDGFSLTAVTAGNNFSVVCGGILAEADVLEYKEIKHAGTAGLTEGYASGVSTVVVANVVGMGTPAQITELELDYSTELGNTGLDSRGVELYSAASRVVSTATYTTYVLTWTTPSDNPLIPKPNMTQQLVIAVPSGDTGAGKTIAALDAILASL